jgi:flagellar basal-body rod protein FlgG
LLVTSDGWALQPPIQIPSDASNITISTNGVVSVTRGKDIESTQVGTIDLVAFANPSGLLSLGKNMYQPSASSGQPIIGQAGDAGLGTLQQGSLEGSNVEIVQEMVEMIDAMRAYEINSKAIKNADEMGQMANNLSR